MAHTAESVGASTGSILELGARQTRREFLKGAASAVALSAMPAMAFPYASRPAPRVAIVGAGLAGLACADRLQSKGVIATVYEGQTHAGGRCHSVRNRFPGQVAEYCGELIDNLGKTMLGYANRFNLPLEDYGKEPGDTTFFFDGVPYSESEVIDQYRILVPRIRADLQTMSNQPTFFDHTAADVSLDNVTLEDYLNSRAGDLPVIRKLLKVAYEIEYGLDASQQSCLNLILFIHADRRAKLALWGVFSDERYHIATGNDGVIDGLLSDFTGSVQFGRRLTGLSKDASGEYLLWFADSSTPEHADAVVMTIPFSVLRHLNLDPSLGLSLDKMRAISELGYGTNAKTMIGFEGAPWIEVDGSNGSAYTNQPNVQNTWETNYSQRGAHAILTDYSGGTRGASLTSANLQAQVDDFLTGVDAFWPGTKARASRTTSGDFVAVLSSPATYPWSLGSYTCYKPGQFTSIAGLEPQRAGNLHFAGEHADSFYEWQGFMEGACLSGLAAANEVLNDIKTGVL